MIPLTGCKEERAVAVICFMIASSTCRFELSSCVISTNSPVASFLLFQKDAKRGKREKERRGAKSTRTLKR